MVYSRKRKLNFKNKKRKFRSIKRGGAAAKVSPHTLDNDAVNEICSEEGAAAPTRCSSQRISRSRSPRRRSRSRSSTGRSRSRSPRRRSRSRSPRRRSRSRSPRRQTGSPEEMIEFNNTKVDIQFPTTEELISYLKELKCAKNKKMREAGLLKKISIVCSGIIPQTFKSKETVWQDTLRKDLVAIARIALTQEAERKAIHSIRNNRVKAARGAPSFVKTIIMPGTGRVKDEDGVSIAKEWYKSIGALMRDARAPSEDKIVSHVTKDGRQTPLNVGEVFMPFELLENILSIKITDKKPGTQGLLFKASDYEAKIRALEILINKIKEIHSKNRVGYRLIDYGTVGTKTPLYSKFRFPQTEFTFIQLNRLVKHRIFPESPGDGDGGVGASTRAIIFPEVPLDFPSTKGLPQSYKTKTKTKKRTGAGAIAVPK